MRPRTLFIMGALLLVAQPSSVIGQEQTGGRPLGFSAMSMNGKRLFINDLVKDGPVFLYFINPGDRVNNEYARRLHQVVNNYAPGTAKWYGVVVGDKNRAESWSAEYKPPYDLLIDEGLSLTQLYGVKSAPTVVRIDQNGNLIGEWAGYSGFRLKQLNQAAADANSQAFKYIDFNDTPSTTRYGVELIQSRSGG